MSIVPIASTAQRQGFLSARRVRGEAFDYTNGSTTLAGIVMIRTRPESNQADSSESVVFESREWNFLVDGEDMRNSSGDLIEPSIGHVITAIDGTRYKVQPIGTYQNCWRWSDGGKTFLRISAVEQ